MKYIFIVLLIVGNSLFADAIPEDFSLSLNDGGGMLPRKETLHITNAECKYTLWAMQNGKEIDQDSKFKMSKQELGDLYKVLLENKYQKITSEDKGQVHDRGGIELEIKANGKTVVISDKYSNFIEQKWTKNWNEIVIYLKQIMKKQRKGM